MQAANELTGDPIGDTISTMSKRESSETVEVLEELLAHSIHLRDLYKNARWQTADLQFRLLRELFTPVPILLINRQVRMNSLENPDPQSLEFGRLVNQCAHLTSPFSIQHPVLRLISTELASPEAGCI